VAREGPTFEIVGDLSDEAIEALAALLLSVCEAEQSAEVDSKSQEVTS
jgi:hypothetical protein